MNLSGVQQLQRHCQPYCCYLRHQAVPPMTPLPLLGTSSLRPVWQVHSPTRVACSLVVYWSVCSSGALLGSI